MDSKRNRFYTQFESFQKKPQPKDTRAYKTGRIQFRIASGVAMLTNAGVMLVLERSGVPVTLYGTAGIFSLILMIWLHYILASTHIRYYLDTLGSINRSTEKRINTLFRSAKLNIEYSSQPHACSAAAHIEALDIFTHTPTPLHYRYYNKIFCVTDNQPFSLYNLVVSENANHTRKRFAGTLAITDIDTPTGYYLRITPRTLLQDYRQKTIENVNTEALKINTDVTEQMLSADFDVFTNDEARTAQLITKQIAAYFNTIYTADTSGTDDMYDAKVIDTLHDMSKTLTQHRIEMLIIRDRTLYALMPFRNIKDGRTHPFDIKTAKNTNPDAMWSDITDVFEKTDVLNTIRGAANK